MLPDTADGVYPFVTSVHRPGLPDVHIGFMFGYQAEQACWSLTADLGNTEHVAGTTVAWSATPAGVRGLGRVPTDAWALADLITRERSDVPPGHAFPDLWSRLTAQEGYETATRTWRAAVWCLASLEDAEAGL